MSLFSIPFYPSLVDKEVGGVKLTTTYVLFIGAVIAHSEGRLNCCVASLETLAEEIGSTVAKVRNIRSELIGAGVIEVLEKDRSGFISAIRCLGDISLGKVELKAFNKKLKGVQQKVETVTEVETGVGDNIIENKNQEQEGAVRMRPQVLYTRLKSIYHIKKDADKKSCIRAVEKLQEVFDDETIIGAAQNFYNKRRLNPSKFSDGRTWWPDFFWVLNEHKFDSVVQEIKKVPGLFRDESEDNPLKGFVKFTDM